MENIAKALVAAQKGFAPALKTATNPHFKSKYAGLDNCVEAVLDSLNQNGIMLIQKTHDCESGIKIETVFLHESGESFSAGVLHVPAPKHDPQGYGSALTYARRYSLMAACGIAPEDDDGNRASATITPEQAANIRMRLESTESDQAKFCAAFKVKSIDQLPATAYAKVDSMLTKKEAEYAKQYEANESAAGGAA